MARRSRMLAYVERMNEGQAAKPALPVPKKASVRDKLAAMKTKAKNGKKEEK